MLAEDAIKSAISNYYTKHPNVKPTNLSSTAAASLPKADVDTMSDSPTSPQAAMA